MQLTVISDLHGKIISISKLADLGAQPSGIIKSGVIQKENQQVHYIKFTPELIKEPLLKIHSECCVVRKGSRSLLVKIRQEPVTKLE